MHQDLGGSASNLDMSGRPVKRKNGDNGGVGAKDWGSPVMAALDEALPEEGQDYFGGPLPAVPADGS